MFDNISQVIFQSGGFLCLIGVPILRMLATCLMVIAIWQKLKKRDDNHKIRWITLTFLSPIIAKVAYEAYCRWINKKYIDKIKGNFALSMISVIAFLISIFLTVASFVLIGVGSVKSEMDNELLASFYDIKGNPYSDVYDVPLYDENGNIYTYQSKWFTFTYVDQNGNKFSGDYCYINEDGYFYYDDTERLKEYKDEKDYYTDGSTIYYDIFGNIYWDEDGAIWEKSGRFSFELFDLD